MIRLESKPVEGPSRYGQFIVRIEAKLPDGVPEEKWRAVQKWLDRVADSLKATDPA